jgi:hypothetical protein
VRWLLAAAQHDLKHDGLPVILASLPCISLSMYCGAARGDIGGAIRLLESEKDRGMTGPNEIFLLAYLYCLTGAWIKRKRKLTNFQRQSLWLAFLSFTVLIVFVVILSVAFDFGLWVYPSREHPYFFSGRLLAAAVPFFLLYAYALDWTMYRVTRKWLWLIVLTGIVLFVVVSQSILDWPAFSSRYNSFI